MPTPTLLLPLNGSLAGQARAGALTATGVGALRYAVGKWAGSQAAFVEEATTNSCTNPSFETSVPQPAGSSGTSVRSSTVASGGTFSAKVTPGGTNVEVYLAALNAVDPASASNQTWTLSADVWIPASSTFTGGDNDHVFLLFYCSDGGTRGVRTRADLAKRDQWQRLSATIAIGANNTLFSPRLYSSSLDTNGIVYWDRIQLEQKAYATSYGDGSLGPGYSWTGTANASSSTRAASSVTIPYTGVLGSLSLMYSEDSGATWTYLYRAAPVAGSIGTNGTITDSGTALTLSSSRALTVGPVMLFDRALTAAEQAKLQNATASWTWGMFGGPFALFIGD